jgi:hypothetical protein
MQMNLEEIKIKVEVKIVFFMTNLRTRYHALSFVNCFLYDKLKEMPTAARKI